MVMYKYYPFIICCDYVKYIASAKNPGLAFKNKTLRHHENND